MIFYIPHTYSGLYFLYYIFYKGNKVFPDEKQAFNISAFVPFLHNFENVAVSLQ